MATCLSPLIFEEYLYMPILRKNEIIQLQITDITNEGFGVGHFNGHTVFVANTAIEDVVVVKVVKVGKNYSYGMVTEIVKPSPHRIFSSCPVYNKCGGCNYQHITYKSELQAKQNQIENAMRRIGKIEFPVSAIIPSPSITHYRNKIIYPLQKINGKTSIGFYAERSHRFIPIESCLLSPSIIDEIANYTCTLIDKYQISIYDEASHTGLVRNLYFRQSYTSAKISLCFVINGNALPSPNEICRKIIEKYPMVSGITLNVNQKQTNVVLTNNYTVLYGKLLLEDTLAGVELQISPNSFYQVNHNAAELLYKTVKDLTDLKRTDTLLDLFCGIGSIGLSFSGICKKVIGVEIVNSAVEMAKINAKLNSFTNTTFICSDAGVAVTALLEENTLPDVVIVDPPRKGCDALTLQSIIKMKPRQIIMISCNPATAARDAAHLIENDFVINAIQPVDMFPRTKHMECVISFSR